MSFQNQFIILFIFLKFISCELEDDSMLRAFSCLSIINKKFNGNEDAPSKSYSPYMLSCFIKITNDQMKTIFSGIEEGKEDLNLLNDDEIEQLTDVDSLQDMPEKDLKKYTANLEKTMKKFEKMDKEIEKMKKGNKIDDGELNNFDDDDFNLDDGDFDYDDDDYDEYDDDDEDGGYSGLKKSRHREKGFFRILFRGIKKFFINSNIWFTFLFLITVYFLLLAMRKSFEAEKEEEINEENDNKENKEIKENKDKEKIEKENDNKEDDDNENKNKNKENDNKEKEKEKQKIKKD